ncbi:hypothetical protein LINPERPRIM_LOCUS6594 [Linum perenne]
MLFFSCECYSSFFNKQCYSSECCSCAMVQYVCCSMITC